MTSNSEKMGLRYPPYAFTEHGVTMLSSILRSKRAVQINISVVRAFVQMRDMLAMHTQLRKKIEMMEGKYDKKFSMVFVALKDLMSEDITESKKIGFAERREKKKRKK